MCRVGLVLSLSVEEQLGFFRHGYGSKDVDMLEFGSCIKRNNTLL